MFRLPSKKRSTWREVDRPPSRNSQKSEVPTTNEGSIGKMSEVSTVTTTRESSSYSVVHWKEAEPISMIDCQKGICSVAFLADDVLSAGREGKIRHWRDGLEMGTPMDAGGTIFSVAVSRNGGWVVSGAESGMVVVWDLKNHEKVMEFKAHGEQVCAVDVSPDGTKIVTGSHDRTACVWSTSSSGQRSLGPWKHEWSVVTAKFSPDGRRVATATWPRDHIRVYNAHDGRLLVNIAVKPCQSYNNSLAWTSNGKQLLTLSSNGDVYRLDASTGKKLLKWHIHSSVQPRCIALASNGTFMAASADRSVSLWDTRTQKQIGSAIEYTHMIESMVISPELNLVTGGDNTVTVHALHDMLPSRYIDVVISATTLRELRIQLAECQQARQERDDHIQSLHDRAESSSSSIIRLEKSNQELRDEILKSRSASDKQNDTIKALRLELQTQATKSVSLIGSLEKTAQDLRDQLAAFQHAFNDERDRYNKAIDTLHADFLARDENSNNEIACLKRANEDLQHKTDSLFRIIRAHEQKHQCESLYAQGRVHDAAETVLRMMDTLPDHVKTDKSFSDWLPDFTRQCIETLEKSGDDALAAGEDVEALAAYSAVLSLGRLTPDTVLMRWASTILIGHCAREALSAAVMFRASRFAVYRAVCDVLERAGRIIEAAECFRRMQTELPDDGNTDDEQAEWRLVFQRRCIDELVKLGDAARDVGKHDEAVGYYSEALLLGPKDSNEILLKRSNELIELDTSSHEGYKEKHAVLHAMGRYSEAVEAFGVMLSTLEQSSDPQIAELRDQYLDITPLIKGVVKQTIGSMPRVLIDPNTGLLYDKEQQAIAFEKLPIYDELRSSMTTRTLLDYPRIQDEVRKFYRYVMFSHRWDFGEPLFQTVQNISVYELESSLPNIKLQTFCGIMRALGFRWVWSDTCCIDKKDNVVLQESLVAMFTWYRGSSLTLVYLRGIRSRSQKPGDLRRSIWNTRAWTYQEYVAAGTVQFYTEDWKPYLGLEMFNHKEARAVVLEMEQAPSGVSAHQLAILQPGLDRVREKLFLASSRQTTLVEDIAYSLLGIFNASIPVIYGEGDRAVGRLLEHVLTGSGDVSILAWTGRAGGYNSCLPVDLTVYNEVIPPHVPQPLETAEMDHRVTRLRSSLLDHSLLGTLYNRLHHIPSPSMAASRLRVSGIVFPITGFVNADTDARTRIHVYRATTAALGDVEIRTADDLCGMDNLILVHPWISPLLDQEFSHCTVGLDNTTRALRLVARLHQAFGALLLAPISRVRYRRVATDCLIVVRVREETELGELMDGIRSVDIR